MSSQRQNDATVALRLLALRSGSASGQRSGALWVMGWAYTCTLYAGGRHWKT